MIDLASQGFPGYLYFPQTRRVYRLDAATGTWLAASPAANLEEALRMLARFREVGTLI